MMVINSCIIGIFVDFCGCVQWVDGEVPAAMHDWKDIPGGNRYHFKVTDHQEHD